MLLESYVKDPNAVLDYALDWAPYLGTDTILTSIWTVDGDVTITQEGLVSPFTQVWVGGGTAGTLADLTNHVVTQQGREDDGTIRLILRHQ